MASWLEGEVIEKVNWHPTLFSLKIKTPTFDFIPGQFIKLGLEQEGKVVSRAYSLVNAPGDDYVEIIAVPVEEGVLSPRLHQLEPGDEIKVSNPATGYLTLEEVPEGKDLWLFSTGTGVGPFISILSHGDVFSQFERVILVHGVRHQVDLVYREHIDAWASQYPGQFFYQPLVTREQVPDALNMRIPQALSGGELSRSTGIDISAQHSRFMLCGNPDMLTEVLAELEKHNITKHLRRKPGQIILERYW